MHDITISQEIIDRVIAKRSRLHLFGSLDPKKTAFVVVDMQNAFCAPGAPVEVPASRGVVPAINKLAAEVRQANGTVIWMVGVVKDSAGMDNWGSYLRVVLGDPEKVERFLPYAGPDGPGREIWHELDVKPEDLCLTKSRYSALAPGTSDLLRALRLRRIENLLIAGTKTNVCCESTGRDAHELDFNVAMVSDCLAAITDEEHRATLETFIQQFGDVVTSDDVIAALHNHPN